MRVVLITGISGSGKSIAINVLEDDGYYCIDNLPVRFLQDVIELAARAPATTGSRCRSTRAAANRSPNCA